MQYRRLQSGLSALLLFFHLRVAVSVDPSQDAGSSSIPTNPLTPPLKWSDIFSHNPSTTEGGCGARLEQLTQWWIDTHRLLYAAIDCIGDALNGSPIARGYLKSYFGIKTGNDPLLGIVNDYIAYMLDFVVDENMFYRFKHPWIFCDSTWLELHSRYEEAIYSDGAPMTVYPDGTEHNPAVENCPAYHDKLWYGNPPQRDVAMSVWWAHDLQMYMFYAPGHGGTFCKTKGKLAGVQDREAVKTMTFCPLAFTNRLQPMALGDIRPSIGIHVSELVPRGGTFYHELFHLVCGTRQTPDASYNFGRIQDALENPDFVPPTVQLHDPDIVGLPNYEHWTNAILVARNPETYVFFSTGYWAFQEADLQFTDGYGQEYTILEEDEEIPGSPAPPSDSGNPPTGPPAKPRT